MDRLAHDPALRMATWNRPGEQVLDERSASQPTQSRLIDILSQERQNREGVRGALGDWVERHLRTSSDHAVRRGTIDIDSFPVVVYGAQEGAAYNGYFGELAYHPIVASFSVAGDYDSTREGWRLGNGFIHAMLRRGNAHTAEGILRFLPNVVQIARRLAYVFDIRLDAGYTSGDVLDFLTREMVRFLGRLKTNAVLERMAAPYLKRPPGRPPKEGYETVIELGKYQAESWEFAQRVILVVVDRPDPKTGQLNLLPDYFFLVTNPRRTGNERRGVFGPLSETGTFEDRLGEFNQLGIRLSRPEFRENEATLLLALLAFNLSNMLRSELEDSVGGCWDLTRFRNYVLKAGGRVAKHSRRLIVHLAQPVIRFWQRLLDRVTSWRLRPRFPLPRGPTRRAWRQPPPPRSSGGGTSGLTSSVKS